MRLFRGGYLPNPALNEAFMENEEENENQENQGQQNQGQQNQGQQNQGQQNQGQQNQGQQNQNENVEMGVLQEQFQNLQVNPNQNLEPLHQLGNIQPIQEEANLPQFVNNVQFEQQYGGRRRKTYRKKNRKTRKHRKNRKSQKRRY